MVEEADATEEEKAIDEVNTSIYCFRRSILAPTLRRLSPANAKNEYYLTDLIGGVARAGLRSPRRCYWRTRPRPPGVNDLSCS